MKYRILFGLLLSCFAYVATAASPSWQLNSGYYVPAKMSMTVVFPRPDGEVSNGARQKWAFADGVMQYRIPIAIQGGAYPFYVSSSSGLPSGMTISSDPNSPNYMKVIWTPAKGDTSTYNCSVIIKDQDGKSVTVTWTVTAVGDDRSHFIFIDPTASTNGSGTKASPLNTMKGIAVAADSGKTSSYVGKIIVLRAGTTTFYGPETSNYPGDYEFQKGKTDNPYIFIGYTGETCTLDMNYSGAFRNYGQSDVYFGQLTLKNAKTGNTPDGTEKDTFVYFDWSGSAHRVTWFENHFQNIKSTSGGASNQAVIVAWNPGSFRNYWTLMGNSMSDYNVSMIDTYTIKYAVIDNNSFLSGTSFGDNGAFNLKSDIQYFSVRSNSSLTGIDMGKGLARVYNQAEALPNDYIELAYNVFIAPNNATALFSFVVNTGVSQAPHVYIYRNTLVGNVSHFDYPGTYVQENNVIISDMGIYGDECVNVGKCTKLNVTAPDIATVSNGNLYGKSSDGFIDQNGMLTSKASKYLGRVGSQISDGTPLLSAPAWR